MWATAVGARPRRSAACTVQVHKSLHSRIHTLDTPQLSDLCLWPVRCMLYPRRGAILYIQTGQSHSMYCTLSTDPHTGVKNMGRMRHCPTADTRTHMHARRSAVLFTVVEVVR